jgi:hypothetical protein
MRILSTLKVSQQSISPGTMVSSTIKTDY